MFRGKADEDYFGLFDGHGGPIAAELAANYLHQEIWKKVTLKRERGALSPEQVDEHKIISDIIK